MREIKKQNIALWISIVALLVNMAIHQYYDFQKYQEMTNRQQKILQNYDELQNLLSEHIDANKEQTELIQKVFEYLQ